MTRYVDRRGRPISEDEWATRFMSKDYRRILADKVELPDRTIEVLTAWGGTIKENLKPFQTDIYVTLNGKEQHVACYGYDTCGEAIRGHRELLRRQQQQEA